MCERWLDCHISQSTFKLSWELFEDMHALFTWAATTSGWRQPEVSAGTQQPRLAATSLSNHITHVLPSLPALIAPSCMVIAWGCYASWSYNTHLYPRPLQLCRKGPKNYIFGRWGTSCLTASATASTMCFVPEWTASPGLGLTPALLLRFRWI